jgi:hypothetical protein
MYWGVKKNTHLVVTGVAIIVPSLLHFVSPPLLIQDGNKSEYGQNVKHTSSGWIWLSGSAMVL